MWIRAKLRVPELRRKTSQLASWCLCGATACTGVSSGRDASGDESVWNLSDRPLLEIGVVEGQAEYELHNAISSIRLSSGQIMVADAGSRELRYFDAEGQYVAKAGGRGTGPGEFRWLSRIYALGGDSVMAYDQAGGRVSFFDRNGTFSRTDVIEPVDPEFPMDVWLYGGYWVDGALGAEARRVVKAALDLMPVPEGDPRYRFARVDSDNNIWVRQPKAAANLAKSWDIFGPGGVRMAKIETPPRFEMHQIGRDFVVGRWLDQDDVNFIRLYSLKRPGYTPPEQMAVADAAGRDRPATDEELTGMMRSGLRNLVLAQEMYYMGHATYAAERDSLEWEGQAGVHMDMIAADARGWVAVLTHEESRTICGMAVGSRVPVGWPEGSAVCN